jgi:hypothetical protein
MQQLFTSPKAVGTAPQGNAPSVQQILGHFKGIGGAPGDTITPQQMHPGGQPNPFAGMGFKGPITPETPPQPPGMPSLSPHMIMQLLQMFGGKSQPMQVPDAATQKVINPMVNR